MKVLNRAIWRSVSFLHGRGIRGMSRIFSSLADTLNCEPLIVSKGLNEAKHLLTPRHYIDSNVLRTGYYEPEILEVLLQELRDGDVFWDIGANFGLHSITIATLRPGCQVIAFEPNPEMVSRIQRGAQLNGAEVTVVPAGVWNTSSIEAFHNPNKVNPGRASLGDPNESRNAGGLQVICHSGDSYIEEYGLAAPNVIKIDTEGAEGKVLSGLAKCIAGASIHTIIFEELVVYSEEGGTLREQLNSVGFNVDRIGLTKGGKHSNWVARRPRCGPEE